MMEEEAAHKEEDTIQTGARPFQLFYLVEKKEQEWLCEIHELFSRMSKFKSRLYLISANIPEVSGGTDGLEVDYPPRAPHPHFRQIIRESESTSGRGSRQQSPSAASTDLSDEQPPQALTPMSPQQVIYCLSSSI